MASKPIPNLVANAMNVNKLASRLELTFSFTVLIADLKPGFATQKWQSTTIFIFQGFYDWFKEKQTRPKLFTMAER